MDGELCENVELSAKGSSGLIATAVNRNTNSYSLKLRFNGYSEKGSYYGLDVLHLNNSISDPSQMRDHLAYTVFHEMGVPCPLTSYTRVTVNGEDLGLYLAVEGMEESFLTRNHLEDAELYKPEASGLAGNVHSALELVRKASSNGALDTVSLNWEELLSDTEVRGADLSYNGTDPRSYPDIFDSSVKNCTKKNQRTLIRALRNLSEKKPYKAVNTDEVIAYFAVSSFIVNEDSYFSSCLHNYYLGEYYGKLMMLPWDNDGAFSSPELSHRTLTYEEAVNAPVDQVFGSMTAEDLPMWNWIVSDEKWRSSYHRELEELLTCCFESGKYEEEIRRVDELIRPYAADSDIWTPEEYAEGVEALLSFCRDRTLQVRKQLNEERPAE